MEPRLNQGKWLWLQGSRMRVVIVDDDQDYLEALKGDLEDRGFGVCTFPDGSSFLQSKEVVGQAHVIVLDWSMPNMPGIDLLQRLRGEGIKVPIIFLTGHSLIEREQAALEEGALDFVDKVRGVDILASRLVLVGSGDREAISKPLVTHALSVSALVLRIDTARAEWRGQDVDLTRTEYEVVSMLAADPGRFVTYRAIYDTMYYEGFQAGRGLLGVMTNVRSHIKRIRQKFRRIDPDFNEIVTKDRVGYAWRKSTRSEAPSTDQPPQSTTPIG
jgi:two-component system response regulator ChvI